MLFFLRKHMLAKSYSEKPSMLRSLHLEYLRTTASVPHSLAWSEYDV
jgi:hypothetical protein